MPAEGLAYCIMRRSEGGFTIPANATDKEILDDFLKFCLNGVRDGQSKPIEAPDGSGKMTGTIKWLAGLGKYQANFYVTRKPTLMFFVSLPDGSIPWAKMPGFMFFIKKNSLTLNLGNGEIILDPKKDLDKALADLKPLIDRVSAHNKSRLLAALRGDPDTDLEAVIDQLEAEESIALRELFQEQLTSFESRVANESKRSKKPRKQK